MKTAYFFVVENINGQPQKMEHDLKKKKNGRRPKNK
jgi:hypothetical protein